MRPSRRAPRPVPGPAAAEHTGSPWYQAISDRVSAAQPSSSGYPASRPRRSVSAHSHPAVTTRLRSLCPAAPAEQRPGERPRAYQLVVDSRRGGYRDSVRVMAYQLCQPSRQCRAPRHHRSSRPAALRRPAMARWTSCRVPAACPMRCSRRSRPRSRLRRDACPALRLAAATGGPCRCAGWRYGRVAVGRTRKLAHADGALLHQAR